MKNRFTKHLHRPFALALFAATCLTSPATAETDVITLRPPASMQQTEVITTPPQQPQAQQETLDILTLESAVLFAFHENPDIQISKLREEQAFYAAEIAKSDFYPQLDITTEFSQQYNAPSRTTPTDDSYKVALAARQRIFDGSSTKENVAYKEQQHQSTAIYTEIEQEEVLFKVIENYLSILRLQKTSQHNQRLVNVLADISNKVSYSVDIGGSSQAKLDYSKARLAFAKTQITETITALNDAINDLEALTGPLPPFKAVLPQNIKISQYQLNEYQDLAREYNNEVILNQSDHKALEHQWRSEKGKKKPQINFELTATQSNDDGGVSVGQKREGRAILEMRYNIFDGWKRDNTMNRIQSRIKELEVTNSKIDKDLTRDIKQAYNQLSAIQKSIQATDDEIQANLSLQKLNQENFELGTIDIIELIEGEERLNIAYAKRHQLISDYYMNMYGLVLRVGLIDKTFFCVSC